MATMTWTNGKWLCECGATHNCYTCRCSSCGEENETDAKGNLIK